MVRMMKSPVTNVHAESVLPKIVNEIAFVTNSIDQQNRIQ